MKLFQNILGMICGVALMIALLITSVEAVTYWTPGYYEQEYQKYHVTEDVHMNMNDLLTVTEEMMEYLRGDRPDLHVPTTVDGQPREFFNAREIAHMEDVRGLFLAGLFLRRVCIGVIIATIALLVILKTNLKKVLPKMIFLGSALFFVMLAVLAALASTDFTKYFVLFHKIFFRNDLWMLDPRTDLLIRIVPEPFFIDTAARIAITYGICVLTVFALCGVLIWHDNKKRRQNT